MKMKLILYIVSLLSSSFVFGYEEYCELKGASKFKFKQFKFEDGDTINTLIYPKFDGANLHRIDLRYGKPNTPIKNEIYTNLAFREFDDRYETKIHLSGDHQPLSINSIYHFENCVSNISLSIAGGVITVDE